LPNDMTIDASVSFGIVTIGGTSTYISIDNGGAPPALTIATNQGENAWQFGPDGVLTLSTASTILGNSSDPNVYIETASTSTAINTWTFAADGSTTLPIGVSIDESNGSQFPRIIADPGKAFSLQGQGSTGSAAIAWLDYESTSSQYAAVGVSGTGTDNLAKVVLTAGSSTPTLKVWRFDETGSLTFPDSTVQTTAYPGSTSTLVNGTYTVALSTTGQLNLPGAANTESNNARIQSTNSIDILSNLSLWTFGTDGTTTLASGVEISNTGTFNFLSWNTGTALIIADVPYTAGSYIYIPSSSDTNGSLGIVNTNTAGSIMLTQGSGNNTTNQLYVNNSGTTINNILGGISKTWTFGTNGSLTFPDATVQTTAYVPATASASTYTGWFEAAGTVVQLDTLLARINSTGTMQISSTIVESIGNGAAFAWNGVRNKGATMSSFGQGGTNWVNPGDWLNISNTPLDNDFEVATVSVFKLGGTGSLYRITYVGSTNNGWAVNIERVGLGTA
jgi:hypothetical protein